MKIANKLATEASFGYTNGTLNFDRWTESGKFYAVNGNTSTPGKELNQYYADLLAKTDYSMGTHINEAIFVADDVIFATGGWTIVGRDNSTGEYLDIQPGEFIYVLKKVDDEWKILRGASFRRGKPINGNGVASSDN